MSFRIHIPYCTRVRRARFSFHALKVDNICQMKTCVAEDKTYTEHTQNIHLQGG